jgi:hypothetical protein
VIAALATDNDGVVDVHGYAEHWTKDGVWLSGRTTTSVTAAGSVTRYSRKPGTYRRGFLLSWEER